MALEEKDTVPGPLSQSEFDGLLHEQVRQAMRLALITMLEHEVDVFIGALPYQRNDQRRDYRNGHYTRDLGTTATKALAC